MLGAIIGDIVGSRFEFNNIRRKDFDFFTDQCVLTDDSIMTLAVAKAIFMSQPNYRNLSKMQWNVCRRLGDVIQVMVMGIGSIDGFFQRIQSHIIVMVMVLL